MNIPINCDSCPHWDLATVRYRGQPEGLCRCPDSIDARRYVSAYHTCSQHPAYAPFVRPVEPVAA